MVDPINDPKGPQGPPNVTRSAKRVEVLVDNLGHMRLMKGAVTDDPRVVALLRTQGKHKLVREVK
jgi:hypothetical protein